MLAACSEEIQSAQTLTELNYQNYLYGGKELDRKFGINAYDFTGRYYDITDNRFWSMDAMAEKRPWESPYSYCGNNPINRVDKDGRLWDAVLDAAFTLYDVGESVYQYAKTGSVSGTTKAALSADALAFFIPGVTGAGLGVRAAAKTVKAVDKAVDVERAVEKTVDIEKAASKVSNPLKNRVKLRNGTKEAVMDAAPKTKDGRFIDPNTGRPIEKGQEVFGHKTGQEWSKYKKDPVNQSKSRQEVINDQNRSDIYQIEDRKSNASHRYESK